ncbi:acid phosphatase, partial [Mesorhizobium sp. M2D.F.Ca.ET.140.01.1.1]
MKRSCGLALFSSALALCAASACAFAAQPGDPPDGIAKIETVVVIFAENRAFDNLYGHFP